ncbi:hypothetical protein [Tersicoccus sp. Bi-70]|uniref:hypothetical protein n=1 Tax=Tersicoccus sp. Bi-70 TaxID=1897634 RepID=UPI0026C99A4A
MSETTGHGAHAEKPDVETVRKDAERKNARRALSTRHLIGLVLLVIGALVAPFDFWLGLIFIAPAFFFLATRVWVAVVVVLLALYLVLTAQRGWLLLMSDGALAKGLGVALLLLPVVGAWVLAREIAFGTQVERMARILDREGGLPDDDLPRRPSGRVIRAAADEAFERYRTEVQADPEDWRRWFRLAWAYDAAGDRTRGRRAMRDAIRRHAENPDHPAQPGAATEGPTP